MQAISMKYNKYSFQDSAEKTSHKGHTFTRITEILNDSSHICVCVCVCVCVAPFKRGLNLKNESQFAHACQ